MKNLLILITIMLVGGCATPLTPKEKKIAGIYEAKFSPDIFNPGGATIKFVFLEDRVMESYENGRKDPDAKWSIRNGEVHYKLEDGYVLVLQINGDMLTSVARIERGKRTNFLSGKITFKKIK